MKTSEQEKILEDSASLPSDLVVGSVSENDGGRSARFVLQGPSAVSMIAIIAMAIVAIVAMLVVG